MPCKLEKKKLTAYGGRSIFLFQNARLMQKNKPSATHSADKAVTSNSELTVPKYTNGNT